MKMLINGGKKVRIQYEDKLGVELLRNAIVFVVGRALRIVVFTEFALDAFRVLCERRLSSAALGKDAAVVLLCWFASSGLRAVCEGQSVDSAVGGSGGGVAIGRMI